MPKFLQCSSSVRDTALAKFLGVFFKLILGFSGKYLIWVLVCSCYEYFSDLLQFEYLLALILPPPCSPFPSFIIRFLFSHIFTSSQACILKYWVIFRRYCTSGIRDLIMLTGYYPISTHLCVTCPRPA